MNIEGCNHGVQHVHGTRQAYGAGCCRCDDCRDAHRLWTKTQAHRFGEGTVTIPATTVHAHVRGLLEAGMTLTAIARSAGVSQQALDWAMNAQRIGRPQASAILNARLQVTAVVVRRRVQALVTVGWTCEQIGARLGMSRGSVSHFTEQRRGTRTPRSGELIAAAYEQMWLGPEKPAESALRLARRKRWAPPMAWDDETIDDARATPLGVGSPATDIDALVEDLLDMADGFRSWNEAVQRCGFRSAATLERRLYRAGRMEQVRAAFRREGAAA